MKKKLCGLEFSMENIEQIINMGGPWICSLYLENNLISDHCIIDNVLEDPSLKRVYFVKYHRTSKWRADNFFTLNYFSINDNEIYQSKRRFEMLYLKKILGPESIEIFYAFHDKTQDRRDVFPVSLQQFVIISEYLK
ncbi:hypothetical protein ACEN9X_07250 [Mucilaginibacter sp. Mucisp86]|uniref:hypothetical protein n=1 Tax=Mucilaginibacter sp. Mucisp86 TaxID=3243060 RepID=UPI0039B574B1